MSGPFLSVVFYPIGDFPDIPFALPSPAKTFPRHYGEETDIQHEVKASLQLPAISPERGAEERDPLGSVEDEIAPPAGPYPRAPDQHSLENGLPRRTRRPRNGHCEARSPDHIADGQLKEVILFGPPGAARAGPESLFSLSHRIDPIFTVCRGVHLSFGPTILLTR